MTVDPQIESYIKTLELVLGEQQAGSSPDGDSSDPLEHLGNAIERFIAQTAERERDSRLLRSITARVSAGLTLEDMLDYIYDAFQDVIPYQRMGLSLLEEDARIVRSIWARSDQPVLLLNAGFTASMAGSSLQTILETGQPRILNDLQAYLKQKPDSISTRMIVDEGFRSSLTCPLVADGQPVGFLFFTSREKMAYANQHIDIFIQIAGQISILLEKGRLVSELADQKENLELINQELQRSNEARGVILAIAAHDLRSPLSYIKTSTDILLGDKDQLLADELPGILAGISRQTRHILDLLDKLLDYSMIEAGQMSLTPEEVDVLDWVNQVVERHKSSAQAKNIQIEVLAVPSGQFVVDPLRLDQVLANLISNAIKFSSPGSRIRVKTTQTKEAWRFAVCDQGPGIRPEEVERLFKPFQRGSAQPTGGEKSTGLGLSIARSIVLAHKGDIGFTPKPQGGAMFWFTIPT